MYLVQNRDTQKFRKFKTVESIKKNCHYDEDYVYLLQSDGSKKYIGEVSQITAAFGYSRPMIENDEQETTQETTKLRPEVSEHVRGLFDRIQNMGQVISKMRENIDRLSDNLESSDYDGYDGCESCGKCMDGIERVSASPTPPTSKEKKVDANSSIDRVLDDFNAKKIGKKEMTRQIKKIQKYHAEFGGE